MLLNLVKMRRSYIYFALLYVLMPPVQSIFIYNS